MNKQHRGENILVCPLPLMLKGESVLVLLLPSIPKGEIFGIMIQVLSLVETHSDESSHCSRSTTKGLQIRLQRMKKERYTLVHFVQDVYTWSLIEKK